MSGRSKPCAWRNASISARVDSGGIITAAGSPVRGKIKKTTTATPISAHNAPSARRARYAVTLCQRHLVRADRFVAARLEVQALRRRVEVFVLEQHDPRRVLVQDRRDLLVERFALGDVELAARLVGELVHFRGRVARGR